MLSDQAQAIKTLAAGEQWGADASNERAFGHATLVAISVALARERKQRQEDSKEIQEQIASLLTTTDQLGKAIQTYNEEKMMKFGRILGKEITVDITDEVNALTNKFQSKLEDSSERWENIQKIVDDTSAAYEELNDRITSVEDKATAYAMGRPCRLACAPGQITPTQKDTPRHAAADDSVRDASRRQLRVEIAGFLPVDRAVAIDEVLKPVDKTLADLKGSVVREYYVKARGSTIIVVEFETQLQCQRGKSVFSTRQENGAWENHISYNARPVVVRFEKSAEAKRRDRELFAERATRIAAGEISETDNLPGEILKRRSLITSAGVVVYAQ